MKKLLEQIRGNIFIILIYRLLIVYAGYTFCRLGFLIYNYSHFPGLEARETWRMFTGGLLFDTVAIVYTNMLFIVLSVLPFRIRHHRYWQQVLQYLFFIVNTVGFAANCADIPYFDFVLARSTFDIFSEFSNESNLLKLSLRFLLDFWPVFLFWISLVAAMIWAYTRFRVGAPKLSRWYVYYPVSLGLMLLTVVLMIGGARGGFRHSTRPITMSNAGQFADDPAEMALVLNTPFTLIKSINTPHYDRMRYFAGESEAAKVYSPMHPGSDKARSNKNVVIIIVESLNREFIGSLNPTLDSGRYAGYTPFLDSLIREGKTFAWSFANGRKSIEAMPSVLSSIPSVDQPFVLTPYYRNRLESLPRLLGSMGYKTAFFHGAPNGSMGFQAFARSIGVKEYYGRDEYNHSEDFDGTWGVWDEPFLQFFANCIDTFPQPFMTALFTVSSHHPFEVPAAYKGKFRKGDFALQECIQYTDLALRRFFEAASGMDWYKNTIFVITADHVSINQRPEFQNELGYFSVPIIFYEPGGNWKGIDSTTLAQQTDIMPTLLDYLGYPKPYLAFGKNLQSPHDANFVFNTLKGTYRLCKDDYFLIYDGKKSISLFNFKKDPLLTENLVEREQVKRDSMELFIQAIIQQYKNRMISDSLMANPLP
jgi:phosphoglycerol transferase MdoB-like AlkP superfamily enzyme